MTEKQYIAIDLKSFYASVECVERGLDPLTTNLVVGWKGTTPCPEYYRYTIFSLSLRKLLFSGDSTCCVPENR